MPQMRAVTPFTEGQPAEERSVTDLDGSGLGGGVPEMPLFSSLGHAAFIRVVDRMERRRLSPEEVLVEAGKGADAIDVVARGRLRVVREGDDRRPVVLGHLHPEVEDILWQFFEDRMVHSLLATSALFQGLDASSPAPSSTGARPTPRRGCFLSSGSSL